MFTFSLFFVETPSVCQVESLRQACGMHFYQFYSPHISDTISECVIHTWFQVFFINNGCVCEDWINNSVFWHIFYNNRSSKEAKAEKNPLLLGRPRQSIDGAIRRLSLNLPRRRLAQVREISYCCDERNILISQLCVHKRSPLIGSRGIFGGNEWHHGRLKVWSFQIHYGKNTFRLSSSRNKTDI